MVMLFDAVMGLGCGCCPPIPVEDLPDIVCHHCKKVLLSARGKAEVASAPAAELDMEPRA